MDVYKVQRNKYKMHKKKKKERKNPTMHQQDKMLLTNKMK